MEKNLIRNVQNRIVNLTIFVAVSFYHLSLALFKLDKRFDTSVWTTQLEILKNPKITDDDNSNLDGIDRSKKVIFRKNSQTLSSSIVLKKNIRRIFFTPDFIQ